MDQKFFSLHRFHGNLSLLPWSHVRKIRNKCKKKKKRKETQGKRQSSYQRIPHNVCWSPGLWALLSDLLPESGGWKEGDIASQSEV